MNKSPKHAWYSQVREVAEEAIARARRGEGPTLIEAETYRFRGHSLADPDELRLKEEKEHYQVPFQKRREGLLLHCLGINCLCALLLFEQDNMRYAVRTEDNGYWVPFTMSRVGTSP